jgi:anti-sigma factor RsiW
MIDLLKIHALADGELSGAEQLEAEALVEYSAEARAEYEAVRSQKEMLAEKAPRQESAEVWTRCVDRLGEIDKTKSIEGFVGRYAWGLCALFFAAIVGAGFFNRADAGGTVTTAEVAGFASGMSPVRSSQPVTASEIERMLGPAPPISLEPERLRIVQVAQRQIEGRQVLRVTFEDAFGYLALMIVPGVRSIEGADKVEGTAYGAGSVDSVPCLVWTRGEFGLMLIGDRRLEELQSVADRLAQ